MYVCVFAYKYVYVYACMRVCVYAYMTQIWKRVRVRGWICEGLSKNGC